MNGPESFTAVQAADPRTPGHVLADIAARRPDLRPALASNPATYPALLAWLSGLQDPAVDAALAARTAGGTTAPATGAPVLPVTGVPAAPATGQWSAPAPYTPGPHTPGLGAAVPSSTATPGPGTVPPPFAAGPYAASSGAPPAAGGSSRTLLWVLLGVAAAVVVVVVGVVVLMRSVGGVLDSIQLPEPTGSDSSTVWGYGDDPRLDTLWDQCAAGDDASCDDLYLESPLDSQYEEFGDTCGHRSVGGEWCVGGRT